MASTSRSWLLLMLLAVIGVVVTILLGNWQMGRARDKASQQARLEEAWRKPPATLESGIGHPEALNYKAVEVRGRFLAAHTIFLDNRLRSGVSGYEVVTPIALPGAKAVLVNRGWLRASPDKSVLPAVPASPEDVRLTGMALPVSTRFVELSEHTVAGRIWQNLDFNRYRAETGLDLLPLVIQQHSPADDGLERNWPRPDLRIDTHRAYAMQWYTMAAAITLFYAIFHVRRKRNRT